MAGVRMNQAKKSKSFTQLFWTQLTVGPHEDSMAAQYLSRTQACIDQIRLITEF